MSTTCPGAGRGEAVDARGDVYQAGAVLYFALTGRPPFPRETTGQTMRAHLSAPPAVPSVIDRRIPRALDRVVVRAMLKDPADRFASVGAMRGALIGSARPVAPPAIAADAEPTVVRAAVAPAAGVAAATPAAVEAAPHDVTRVLGRTSVPPSRVGFSDIESGRGAPLPAAPSDPVPAPGSV